MAGLFITFEGGEGSGKSTQVARLAEALRALGRTVVTTREPGGTTGADMIREMVLGGDAEAFGNDVEAALFAAARADHVDSVIAPALAGGADVICDRFHDSTRVYQGRGDNARYLEALEDAAMGDCRPAMTFILDLPAEEGLGRAAARRKTATADRFEAEASSLHEERRLAFLAIAAREPERCHIIDARRPADVVADDIVARVVERLGLAEA